MYIDYNIHGVFLLKQLLILKKMMLCLEMDKTEQTIKSFKNSEN
jgi:hypothetical protein